MGNIDPVIIAWMKRRDSVKEANDRVNRFNTAPGLKQFTVPEEKPIRHTFRDDTANTAIGRATR